MRTGTPAAPEKVVSPIPGDRELLFISPRTEIRARVPRACITVPAFSGETTDSQLSHAVTEKLENARRAGQAQPIVVGAIPFDKTQPACLYIPQEYERSTPAVHIPSKGPLDSQQLSLVSQETYPDRTGFESAVNEVVNACQAGDIQKAVLSAKHVLTFSESVNVPALLANLRRQNPIGYQFRVPMPEGSDLIGVSPELLLYKNGTEILCNPLAGSAKRHPEPDVDQAIAKQLIASSKDLSEHSFVVQDMHRNLEPLCSKLNVPERPSLINTPALWHLSTWIEGQVSNPEMSALDLALKLHPTPAVCGFPTDKARELIQRVEPFDRGLFTGVVGWCDADGNGEWAVTIRCGTVKDNQVNLFAGAGVIEASHPESEWAEIQTKLSTMLKACGLTGKQKPSERKPEVTS